MAESIRIGSANVVQLLVNDDPEKVIRFDPSDIQFIENLYDLMADFEKKEKDFMTKDRALRVNKDVDKRGVPVNFKKHIQLVKTVCAYMREKIDILFGAGTSEKAFGNSLNIELFSQFFEGIVPYIKKERDKKVVQFLPPDEADSEVME